ncbi:MAG: hypothetical protein K1X75_13590 [Leptospirales bacterium]|nr:hypothetical protein [Leptospirales bacterium]
MRYTIWRIGPGGEKFPLSTLGAISSRQRAFDRARSFTDRLKQLEPDSEDRFIVQDEEGRELKSA